MSKAELIEFLAGNETTASEVLALAKLSRPILVKRVQAAMRRQERYRNTPCPNGHKAGDPNCDLTCWITAMTEVTPFLSIAAKLPASGALHAWMVDAPTETTSQLAVPSATMERSLYSRGDADLVRRINRAIDRHLDLVENPPHWTEHLPWAWGWWWRVPYGWYLWLDRALTPARWR